MAWALAPSALATSALATSAPAPATKERSPAEQRLTAALLEDGSLKVRARAAFVIAGSGSRESVPALRRALLEDMAAAVRFAAAVALGRVGGKEAAAALRDASVQDKDPAVRAAATGSLDDVSRGGRTVALEEGPGGKGDARARAKLRDALAVQLARRGFEVVGAGEEAGFRLRASLLRLDEARMGPWLQVEVKASVVVTDTKGRNAAMIEGGARARTAASDPNAGEISGQALDAAARELSEDLAHRLLQPPSP